MGIAMHYLQLAPASLLNHNLIHCASTENVGNNVAAASSKGQGEQVQQQGQQGIAAAALSTVSIVDC